PDYHHAPAVTDGTFPQRETCESLVAVAVIFFCFLGQSGFFKGRHSQKLATLLQFFFAVTVAEEAVVADTMETVGQDMEQEAADKFVSRQSHGFLLAVITIVLVVKLHLVTFDIEQAIIGESHAVGVATYVVENLLRSGKGCLGIDHPFALA